MVQKFSPFVSPVSEIQLVAMNRQSGSQLPIPVTPKDAASPSQQPLLQFSATSKPKRKSREGRLSWLPAGRYKTTPTIWRPSTGHTTPPTPQWPLPRVPINIRDANPALTKTYTQPRDAPLPPPPSSCSSRSRSHSRSSSTTTTLTTERGHSPRPQKQTQPAPPHPLSPHSPPCRALPPYGSKGQQQQGAGFQTRYMNMLLNNRKIPRSHNILSNLFAWMILLAFVIAPGNFTSPTAATVKLGVKNDAAVASTPLSTTTSLNRIPSVALLAASCSIFALGALGMTYLALCWRHNYIWLINRIYLPLVLNSLAGFIASLVVIDVQHHMWWSVAAYVSVSIEAATLLFSATMFFVIDHLLLGKLKKEHDRQNSSKNVVDLVKAGKRPPFAPGSVV